MSLETSPSSADTSQHGTSVSALVRLLDSMLPRLDAGRLMIVLPNGGVVVREGAVPGPDATMIIRQWRTLWRILASGDKGFSDTFIENGWTTPDLTALLNLFDVNAAAIDRVARLTAVGLLRDRIFHWRNDNSRRGSRRNIAAHYDLGNSFYRLWLDSGMNYSSALYRGDEELERAQIAKLEKTAELLQLNGGETVLEIGCGWGALAEHLAQRHGCKVTGLTLSTEQLAYAQDRIGAKAEFRLQDYRDCAGCFDRIVSIEMLEAVGERYWPVYFDTLNARLTEDGVAVVQVITIDESRFEAYRGHPDFIQRHIFPGGMLPTRTAIEQESARAGFEVSSWIDFGDSYARTLAEWRRRFQRVSQQLDALGFDRRFQRMWHYYLSYCEAGFLSGAIDVSLIKLTRARS